jgi:hypothetical protein
MRRQRDGVPGADQALGKGEERLHVAAGADGWHHDPHCSPPYDPIMIASEHRQAVACRVSQGNGDLAWCWQPVTLVDA